MQTANGMFGYEDMLLVWFCLAALSLAVLAIRRVRASVLGPLVVVAVMLVQAWRLRDQAPVWPAGYAALGFAYLLTFLFIRRTLVRRAGRRS